MRAAVYVRLSQDSPETTSPIRQREACEKLIADRGWTYSRDQDLHEDVDFSAWTGRKRPAFERLKQRLDRYDVIVYWKLDRLARSVLEYAQLMQAAEAADVTLLAVVEGEVDTSTPAGRAMSQVSMVFAELESATISLRQQSSAEHLARTGRWKGGATPYGYRAVDNPNGPGRILEPDPDRLPMLLDIVDRIMAGESARSIANDLNVRGIPTSRHGARWTSRTIVKMCRNPRLRGYAIHHDRPIYGDDGMPLVVFEPLIDRPTFDRLQRALDGRDRKRGTTRAGATLLSGLAVCGRCQGPMTGWTADHPRASYACSRRASAGPSSCPGNAVKRAYTDDVVTKAVLSVIARTDLTRIAARRQAGASEAARAARAADLEAALDRLETDRLELGLYDDPDGRQRYADRYRRLAEQLAEIRDPAPAGDTAALRLADAIGDTPIDDVTAAWEGWSDRRRRQVVAALVEKVVVEPFDGRKGRFNPNRVRIDWRE